VLAERHEVPQVIRELLDKGMVRIIVDATRPGVLVPEQLQGNPQLHLNLSYRFDGHNMRFGQHALCVTLSFAHVPFRCEIPWHAIVAAGVMPREPERTSSTPRKRGHLSVVK
jgi:stringent starvation protein B